MMIISYKYRIYPTSKQIAVIEHQLGICQWLYNAALEHGITAFQAIGKSISYKDQQNELPSIKADFPEFKNIHSQVLQNILRRIDGSFQHFFRRMKRGEKPGFPRFKGKDRFDAICYLQSGFRMMGNKVGISKIGDIIIKWHRPSRTLVNTFDLVAFEDLDIKQMVQGKFTKSIHDAGWGKFIEMIKYKAESAGSYAISVNPYHTTQLCSNCGTLMKKEIDQRSHECPVSGLSLHRDHNAAIHILKSGTDAVFQMPRQLAAG